MEHASRSEEQHRPRGALVWFTGLPASGKTTLARQLKAELARAGRAAVLLDSDELREVLEARSYAPGDRDRFYHSLAALAVLLARQGVVALVAATAPHRVDRDRARAALAEAGRAAEPFVEVWVKTPLPECEARDSKGLYAKARRGETRALPGVNVAYEEPTAAEVVAERGEEAAAVAAIVHLLGGADASARGAAQMAHRRTTRLRGTRRRHREIAHGLRGRRGIRVICTKWRATARILLARSSLQCAL